jgi:hypothetical protein
MKDSITKLTNEVWKFIRSDFHPASYIYTFLFVSVCIFINYKTGFYKNHIRESYYTGNSYWTFPLFYASMYYLIAIPVFILRKKYELLTSPKFYLKSLLFITLYGTSIGFFVYNHFAFSSFFSNEYLFLMRIIAQFKSIFFYFIPLVVLKLTVDKEIEGLYGLSKNKNHIKGYFKLFLILLPFIILMSFTADFQKAYPQFKPWKYGEPFGCSYWESSILFQISYATDFIMTELMFRGALIIGMTAILGREAILPMVGFYVAIHFGKPLGETISSMFGGFILGALAYRTRHIWGGVIVHILIALSMEWLALFQHFRQ